jgi:peptide-methionine (S)-S-oxide reductase
MLLIIFSVTIVDAESIRISFDSSKLKYNDLLQMFVSFHTPSNPRWTGSQYRSAIFYHTKEQKENAISFVKTLGALGKYIAVEPASAFYRGEDYHQKYLEKCLR